MVTLDSIPHRHHVVNAIIYLIDSDSDPVWATVDLNSAQTVEQAYRRLEDESHGHGSQSYMIKWVGVDDSDNESVYNHRYDGEFVDDPQSPCRMNIGPITGNGNYVDEWTHESVVLALDQFSVGGYLLEGNTLSDEKIRLTVHGFKSVNDEKAFAAELKKRLCTNEHVERLGYGRFAIIREGI